MTATQMDRCIELCWECRTACMDTLYGHCLQMGGKHVEQAHVKLMSDCIEICQVCADFMRRGSAMHQAACRACADICAACAQSCETVGGEDMEACAKICRACSKECESMAGGIKKAA
jgi:hypothetical protein